MRPRGRPNLIEQRLEKVRALFQANGNRPVHYKDIMKRLQIRSERTFYQIADLILQKTKKPGFYVLWRGNGPSSLEIRDSEELRAFLKLRQSSKLHGFIRRRSSIEDPVTKTLRGDQPVAVSVEDKRYRPPFSRDPDRVLGAIIYGVKSSRGQNSKDDSEEFFRMLTYAGGGMNPLTFSSLIPEAIRYACQKRLLDSDLVTGARELTEIESSEVDEIRKAAFGSAQRVFALYTFDVEEAFDRFFQDLRNKDEAAITMTREAFAKSRPQELDNSQVAEKFMNQLRRKED